MNNIYKILLLSIFGMLSFMQVDAQKKVTKKKQSTAAKKSTKKKQPSKKKTTVAASKKGKNSKTTEKNVEKPSAEVIPKFTRQAVSPLSKADQRMVYD